MYFSIVCIYKARLQKDMKDKILIETVVDNSMTQVNGENNRHISTQAVKFEGELKA